MKYQMKMPDLATTGSAIRVVRWLKQPGQSVKRGDLLLDVETDKSTMEVESTVTGTLQEIVAAPETEVASGEILAVFEVEGDSSMTPQSPTAGVQPAEGTEVQVLSAETPLAEPASSTPAKTGMFARNRASGVQNAAPSPSAERVPIALSPAQRTAARRLQESKHTIPHFYLQHSANASGLIDRRKMAGDPKPYWDAFFVKAVAALLPRFDRFMYRYEDGRLVPQPKTNIGVATDIDGELYVISIDSASTKGVAEISDDLRRSVGELRAGNPSLMRVIPGAFTISNLGSTGVRSFTAIINPPEAAILAIGAIEPTVVTAGTGFAIQPRVVLTLSVDHRVMNGKYAAQFLAALVSELETLPT